VLGGAGPPSDDDVEEIFTFSSIYRRRAMDFAYEPLREILTVAARPGQVVVIGVARLREVAERFGMQGLRDTAKLVAVYASMFAPPEALESQLAWSVAALFIPQAPGLGEAAIDTGRIRRIAKNTSLELEAGETVRIEVAVGVASFDGVHADEAIDGAVADANRDIMMRVADQDGPIVPLERDWRPHFPQEYPGPPPV
jgi:hypothetical protein